MTGRWLLDPARYVELAEALGDRPETVHDVHRLRRGMCRACVAGTPACFEAAIIQGDDMPDEPNGYGSDAALLWSLLQHVEGWRCIDVETSVAAGLGEFITAHTGRRTRLYGDVYHTLTIPAPVFVSPFVRRLTLADLALYESADPDLWVTGFGDLRALLTDSIVAGAIVEGQLVAVAVVTAQTERYADIGVQTLAAWRGRGFATCAASIVARAIQEAGRIPVWSAREDNIASLRIAARLGFCEVSRRVYVIMEPQ